MKHNLVKHISLSVIALIGASTIGFSQTQKGLDIDGEATNDESGSAVSMPDENTIAVGAAFNDGGGTSAGHTRVYVWNGGAWEQKGNDIDGEAADDESGKAVSMPTASTIAIGAARNDGNGDASGHVRIYSWNGNAWIQKGNDIDGGQTNERIGTSVSMPDENTVCIGGNNIVRVYTWNGNSWIQQGNDLTGLTANDYFGASVKMVNPTTLAVGAPGASNLAGTVTVYAWNGSGWGIKGTMITGEAAGDKIGRTIDMSDENTIAIGSEDNDGNGSNAGHVRVYAWNNSNWSQVGTDIEGAAADVRLGATVSMPDPNTLAISANGTTEFVRFYVWNGTAWNQVENDILAEATDDELGWSMDMPVPGVIGVGAPYNDGNGNFSGHARVFEIDNLDLEETSSESVTVFPNPTSGLCTIALNEKWDHAMIRIVSVTSEQIFYGEITANEVANINLKGAPGLYFAVIQSGERQSVVKIIKK